MASTNPSTGSSPKPLAGRRVLLGVSGGIACFKAAALCSKLVQAGAEVRVVMTEAAAQFVTPLTFESLSGKPVQTSMWRHDDHPESQHVGLARWCELFVVAPATADLIAKLNAGLTPDPVTLIAAALPGATPLLLAPAMNSDMWANPVCQRNVAALGATLPNLRWIGPANGWQACRTEGAGRMSEPEEILAAIAKVLAR